MSESRLIRDMARYIQYLENQHESIANREDMPSRKWWESATEETQGNFLRAVDELKEGSADLWWLAPLGEV